MKKIPFVLFFSLLFFQLTAQQSWKIPLSLYEKVSQYPASQKIRILVKGNPVEIAEAAKKHSGTLLYNEGYICSVCIPAGELVSFSKEDGIEQIGGVPHHMQTMNDTMKVQTRLNECHAGNFPLTQAYKGDNVIVGLIDSGIDFNHPDFKDANGDTRILYIWDQNDQATGPSPVPFGYGTEWDSAQINAGSCTENDLTYWGHGTHVSGIAAGNGLSTTARDYSGGAPNANIIMVCLDFNYQNSTSAVADASEYIFNKAMALGRPCVINASVGDYYGSHDGQDPEALMIDSMLGTSGRSFVCASGNAGNLPIHLGYTLSSDTNLTWFSTGSGSIYLQVWADTNNFNGAKMAIGCTQDVAFVDRGRTSFTNMQNNLFTLSDDTIRNSSGQRMAIVHRYGSTQGNAYSMEFIIVPDSLTGYNYSLQMTGSGSFHLWSFDVNTNALPSSGVYPNIVYYKQTDTTHTVCSSFQCSNKTITVGNYVNRDVWMDVNNTWQHDTTVVAGEIMWNSSVGPTRDGRNKPDITAPGANDISCTNISELPNIIAALPSAVGVGGFHVVDGGTSASSPVVAGSVALYLQMFPNATWQDCKNAVEYCAHQDGFTGASLPDNTWGYGKVDAFSMLTSCALATGSSAAASNNFFSVYPNPVNGNETQLHVTGITEISTIEIYSSNGQLIYTGKLNEGETSFDLPSRLNSGLYLIRVTNASGVLTQRLVVN
ncbi:MAG TPA: S8 family peptidase [Bacteroidia bacterium]|jgi:subtilisin family serine protease|nr:S8 family peptidase [Bacteroidia bacterium]